MSYFMQDGDKFFPAQSKESLLEGLPPGNFVIEQSMTGLYFRRTESFQPENKVYGHLDTWAERTLSTFANRESSTGILLSGEKGSGKSLLGRLISLKAREKNIPTVVVNLPYDGATLCGLLGQLAQSAVVFFDEFEKVYHDKDVQESILSLLDGTLGTKHLFIITCNYTYSLSNLLLNRPGRIFYFIEFNGIEKSFIKEYCEDNLNNKSEITHIIKISKIFEKFNFDMLKSLVEEMNRYGESALKAIELLNIVPSEQRVTYKLSVTNKNNKKYKVYPDTWIGFPLENEEFHLQVENLNNTDEDLLQLTFLDSDLKNFDPESQIFTYINDKDFVLTFKTPEKKQTLWSDSFYDTL